MAHRRRVGRWERVAVGVWRLAGAPATWWQELTIALAWAGPVAVLARECAAARWGFDGFPPGPVEVLVPRSGRGRQPGPARVHTTTELRPIDRAVVAGFPVTSASRTVIDLAGEASGCSMS